RFRDEQVWGPFPHWVHTHDFLAGSPVESRMRDHVDYEAPLGMNGGILGDLIHERLDRLFCFRHARLQNDFKRLAALPLPPHKILISGASGFVGTPLSDFLGNAGHEVWALVRRPARPEKREIAWDYAKGIIDEKALEGFDAVIHLAGESIASGRWNLQRKFAIRHSRLDGTRFLAKALAGLAKPPKAFLAASAIGFYGNRDGEELTEESDQGYGFLPEICADWESAADPLRALGVRVAHLRTGIALNGGGGALGAMLRPFELGLGGQVGSGRQWMSWIALEDLIGAYYFLLCREDLSGVFNATAPHPATNRDFTQTLGKVLDRSTVLPLPAFAVKALLGEMGESLLLEGQKVMPRRLEQAGFEFFYPQLEPALRFETGNF
ncbi:MAG TPA: TIGR01777 family oxidoreductase, partial [bacterium]|nr:TIGR01777 family oxidoreductase [bacterium]